jgi:hypothetical protein
MQLKVAFQKALIYGKNILLVDLGISLIILVTFLIRGPFSFGTYSDRLFWAGLGVTLLAGIVGFAIMFAGRSFGIPLIIRRPEEARRLLDHMTEYRDEVDKRYDTSILIFLTGLGCIALSALVQILLA